MFTASTGPRAILPEGRTRAGPTELRLGVLDKVTAQKRRLTSRRSVPTPVIGSSIQVEPSDRRLDPALVGAGLDLNR